MCLLSRASLGLAVGLVAALLVTLPSLPAFAPTSGDIVSAGSVWMETTIAVAMVFVTVMAFSLQIARGYFLRILNKFTLRLGADIWWLSYVLIRDGLIFASFIMGLMVFFPGTFLDYPIEVPFMPVSVVLFGAALVLKLYFDADDNRNAFKAVTALVFGGTLLWIFSVIFITETPLALSTLPPGVSSTSGLWAAIYNTFSTTAFNNSTPINLGLAMLTFNSTFAALGVLGVIGFAHPLLHSRLPKLKRVESPALTIPTAAPSPVTRTSEPPLAAEPLLCHLEAQWCDMRRSANPTADSLRPRLLHVGVVIAPFQFDSDQGYKREYKSLNHPVRFKEED